MNKLNLKEYSLLAGIIITQNQTILGQIIYTDIEPDLVVEFEDSYVDLDIDNDGASDFSFKKHYFLWSNTDLIICYSFRTFEGHISNINNGFVGHDTPPTFWNEPIYALDFGYLINGSAEWNDDAYQNLAKKKQSVSCSYWTYALNDWDLIGSMAANPGEDKYVGIRFTSNDPDCKYYGWIRLAFTNTLETLTIMDFAYNANCGEGVFAGTLTSQIENTPIQNWNLSNNETSLIINVTESLIGSSITIYNAAGQKIKSENLNELQSIINITELPGGLYFAAINESMYAHEFFINP